MIRILALLAISLPASVAFLPLNTVGSMRFAGQKFAVSKSRCSQTFSHGLKCMAVDDEPLMRIGHGWDIHRLAPLQEAGQGCVIGGVTVENFDLGVVAHSDGDVLYHSATDAILGALTLPDIGQFFPDTDPRWKGCDSEKFLDEAWKQMDARGYMISNMDVTLVLQVSSKSVFPAHLAPPYSIRNDSRRLVAFASGWHPVYAFGVASKRQLRLLSIKQ